VKTLEDKSAQQISNIEVLYAEKDRSALLEETLLSSPGQISINRRRLSSFGNTLTLKKVVRKSRGGVQLQLLQLGTGLGLWFLDFLLGALSLEKGALSLLVYLLVLVWLPRIILFCQRLQVLGGGFVPMVG
jgi:hypothetical protein